MAARVSLPHLFIALVLAAAAAALGTGLSAWSSAEPAKYLSFTIVALLASVMKVNLPAATGSMSLNFVFMLIGVSEFSLGEALLTGVLGALVQSLFRTKVRPKAVQVLFNVANAGCSIRVAFAVHHSPHLRNLLLTSIAYFLFNTLLTAAVIALTEQKNVWHIWRNSFLWAFPNYLAGASAAWAISATSSVIGWQPGMLLLPILYVLYRSHSSYVGHIEEARKRAEQQKAHAEEVAALHRRTIETLALAIEAKDQTTRDHLERVEVYSTEVGRELGLGESELEALSAAALLHDIGKIAVPEYIISKPGRLTPAEFEKMKTHTVVGAEIVERIRFPYSVAPMIRGHHERWDGAGYPDGLAGEEIPIGARILAAVDCLDALVSDRQYRRALSLDDALGMIRAESGKSLDARVVEILVRRAAELSRLVKSGERIAQLTVDVKVERGRAPAAGFEDMPASASSTCGPENSSRDLAHLNHAVSEGAKHEPGRNATFAALKGLLWGVVPYDLLVLYLIQGDHLSPVYLEGEDYKTFASLEIPMGAGLSGWVAENGRAIVNGNPSVEPGYLNDPARFSILRSALAVPLISPGGITGVLSLYLRGANAFTAEHRDALAEVAPILAETPGFATV